MFPRRLAEARVVLREQGALGLARHARRWLERHLVDARWRVVEHRRGFRFEGRIPASELGVSGPGYEPLAVWQLLRALSQLPIRRREFVFVDLGAGKGRLVLAAAWAGFARAVGVEVNPMLATVAGENARRFPGRRLEIVEADAGTFELPREPCVVFMFNPFDAGVLVRVVERIARRVAESDLPLYVVYWNPVHAALLDAEPSLDVLSSDPHVRIYTRRR